MQIRVAQKGLSCAPNRFLPLGHRRPGHGYQDSRVHGLDERNGLVHRLGPTRYAPAVLAADLPLLEVGKLPEVVHRVQIANLHKPSTNALHHLAAGLQAPTPVCLPLEQVSRVERV